MDTTRLYALAWRLDGYAEVVRARAHLLATHGDRLRWRSPAARQCRIRLDGICAELVGCAGRAETVADQIRTHAGRLQHSP